MGEIKRITIKGFKSIKSLEDFELGHLNVIIGANGAGKSNFVQVFKMLNAMSMKGFQSYIFENGGAKNFPYNGFKETPKLEFGFEFTSRRSYSEGSNFYSFTLKPTPDMRFIIEETRGYRNSSNRSYGPPDLESRLADEKEDKVTDGTGNSVGHFIYDAISHWMVYHFHDTSLLAPMRTPELKEDNKYLRSDASNIAPFLLYLKNYFPENYKAIVYAVKAIMPFFDDFTLDIEKHGPQEDVSLTWHQVGTDFPFQSFHFSDGAMRFICLATALLQPIPPSTIIIDEPELGLHPSAIELLANLIEVASRNTQVIVATQSPLLLNQFDVENVIIAKRKAGATTLSRVDGEQLKLWLEEYSLGDLWIKDILQGGISHE